MRVGRDGAGAVLKWVLEPWTTGTGEFLLSLGTGKQAYKEKIVRR